MESTKIAFLHPHEPIIVGSPEKIKDYLDNFFKAKIASIAEWSEDEELFALEEEELQQILERAKNAIDAIYEGDCFQYEFNLSTFMSDREEVLMLHIVEAI